MSLFLTIRSATKLQPLPLFIARTCAGKSVTPATDDRIVDNVPTHTGQVNKHLLLIIFYILLAFFSTRILYLQKFEESDYRISRFLYKEGKEVNTQFAIKLIEQVKPIAVKGRSTYCDGGDGPLGHPRVFINLDQPGNHSCGYCGLRFYQEEGHHH